MKRSFGEWSIRSYEESDIPAVVKYGNNRNVWKRLTDIFPSPYTETDAKAWIELVQSQETETNFAIATEKELIGSIGFDLFEGIHCKTAALGYWLGEPYWGKGIVSDAVRAMTDYIFTHHDVVRIQASVFNSNLASARVLEKAGYTFEACLRKHVFKDNQVLDLLIYSILRHEWENRP